MAGQAVPRPNWDPSSMTLEDWMTAELTRNPSYRLPAGYHVEAGQVVRDQPPFLLRHPWLFPAMGLGAGAGLAAAGGAAPEFGITSAAHTGVTAPGVVAASQGGVPAATTAATVASPWLRYGLPAVGTAIGAIEENQNRKEQARESNQRTAVLESELDPFRGVMHQTQDVARLDHMASPPPMMGPPTDSFYGRYINRTPLYTPSDTMLTSARNAQQLVAHGQGTVPTMLDDKNWGQTGVTDLTQPLPAAAVPAGRGLSPAALLARRRRPFSPPAV
jgi:hypothetical protein